MTSAPVIPLIHFPITRPLLRAAELDELDQDIFVHILFEEFVKKRRGIIQNRLRNGALPPRPGDRSRERPALPPEPQATPEKLPIRALARPGLPPSTWAAMRQGKKCILFVAPVPPPVHGGALAMQYLLEELRATDLEVLHVDSKFAASLDDIGKFSLRKLVRLPRYGWQMLRHVMRGGVDLVVLTPTFHFRPFLKDALLVWWSTLVLQRKTVAWFHMDYRAMHFEELSGPARWFVHTTLRRCGEFVLCAEKLRTFMPGWMPAAKISALPNGIPAPVPPRARRDDGRLRILYLSNLEEAKGWQVLLDAARELCRAYPHVEFVFHGRPAFGLTEDEIRAGIANDDGAGRICYLGPVFGGAKWQALADADIFAFPSFHESFPLSVLEALAAGLPVVATDVGGISDALTEGEGGFLVPPRDAGALRAALERVISDAALRDRMGKWNRERYLRDYTVAAYGARWAAWLTSHAS